MTEYGTVRISENLLSEVTETIQKRKLWVNEVDFIREAIREKIATVEKCVAGV